MRESVSAPHGYGKEVANKIGKSLPFADLKEIMTAAALEMALRTAQFIPA